MAELIIRLVASLAVVVGLMLLLARFVGKRYGTRAGAPVQVLHRQPLSRSSSVAVVTVGSRVLVVGTTDHQVSLLAELDPEELEVADADLEDADALDTVDPLDEPLEVPTLRTLVPTRTAQPGAHRGARRAEVPRREPDAGALAGSVLSPQTWRQALAAATGKAS